MTSVAGAGVGGSTRVTIIFPDYSILKQWLQVTVGATPQTGLQSADVFYFGNAVGESNSPAGSTVVDSSDEIAARNNPASFLAPVGLTNAYDFNRDGLVNGIDQILARSNTTSAVLQTNLVTLTNPPGLQQGLTSGNSSANPSATTGSSSSSAVAFGLAQLSSAPATPLAVVVQPAPTLVATAKVSAAAAVFATYDETASVAAALADEWSADHGSSVRDDLLELITASPLKS